MHICNQFPPKETTHANTLIVTTAALLALGFSAANAADNSAPGGTGVVQSTEGKGATNKDTTMPMVSMGSKDGANTGMQPGSGIEDSAAGKGATDKQGMDETKGSKTQMGGASSGTAPGGTGVEQSSEGEGATQTN